MIVTLEAFMVWKDTIKGKKSKNLLQLRGERNLLKISSMKAFFHIPLLHSKHPVNNILQELINHQTHKKFPILLFQNWWKFIFYDRITFLYKIDRGSNLLQTQFNRLMGKTFLVTGSSAEIRSNLFCVKLILHFRFFMPNMILY